MCGIAVIINKSISRGAAQKSLYEERLTSMIQCMKHRGPDEEGMYAGDRIGLAMTRLSIVGGDNGSQPIWNEDQTLVVVCNGEIYNHQTLRASLKKQGHVFSTQSDVEVILHLYEMYREKCLEHLEGIFALAVWDLKNQSLLVARDRLGVKPLYYSDFGPEILFSSELRSLLKDPKVDTGLDEDGLSAYHAFRFVPPGKTLVKGIKKLAPAEYMIVKQGECKIASYWSANFCESNRGTKIGERTKPDQLKKRLMEAVKSQAAPEVKSGIFLSGGLDSSALLAMNHELFGKVPDTFTVAFTPPNRNIKTDEYNEIDAAKAVAKHYHARHFDQFISPDEVLKCLPAIISALDEPIADPTAIPLWFVSRLAQKSGMKVVYSGEGLDELFGGYAVYRSTHWLNSLKLSPAPVRRFLASSLSNLQLPGSGVIQRSLIPVSEWYQGVGGVFSPKEWKGILREGAVKSVKDEQIRAFVKKIIEPVRNESILKQMIYFDLSTWLPENTLVKSDKISMAHSLELRVPFLDRNVVEFSMQVEDRDKIRGNVHKKIVREALADTIPKIVTNRPKIGFPIPISAWIMGEWKDFVLSTLLDPNAFTRGIYRPEYIEQLMNAPAKTQKRSTRLLWTLLSLELWFQHVYSASLSEPEMSITK